MPVALVPPMMFGTLGVAAPWLTTATKLDCDANVTPSVAANWFDRRLAAGTTWPEPFGMPGSVSKVIRFCAPAGDSAEASVRTRVAARRRTCMVWISVSERRRCGRGEVCSR